MRLDKKRFKAKCKTCKFSLYKGCPGCLVMETTNERGQRVQVPSWNNYVPLEIKREEKQDGEK